MIDFELAFKKYNYIINKVTFFSSSSSLSSSLFSINNACVNFFKLKQ